MAVKRSLANKHARLWGSLPSCVAVGSRHAGRLAIGPQVNNLPHTVLPRTQTWHGYFLTIPKRIPRLVWGAMVCCLAASSARKPFTEAELRGRQIYQKGESPSGREIVAEIGGSSVAASVMPCTNCHGPDGRGSTEGGVTPTSLRWADLSRPYEVASPSGRRHTGYDRQSFRIALAAGRDPGGNRIGEAMPRFRISEPDLDDLLAWLRRIGEDAEEGITGDTIVIGSLLPGDAASSGPAVQAALGGFFGSVNESGGIFGRRFDFHAASLPTEKSQRIHAAKVFLDDVRPFALVASYTSGFEAELDGLLREREVPVVGAYTPSPIRDDPPNPAVFYLDAGLRGQSEELARFGLRRFDRRLTMVVADAPIYRESANAVRALSKNVDEMTIDVIRRSRPEMILLLAPIETAGPLLDADWAPQFLVPGALADESALHSAAAHDGRLYLAYPTLPSDYEPEASQDYARLAEAAHLPARFVAPQLLGLAAARLLVNGLVDCGRELSRPKLIAALEGLYQFHTGFTPPVTFTQGRRIGFTGAHIVTWDAASGGFKPVP